MACQGNWRSTSKKKHRPMAKTDLAQETALTIPGKKLERTEVCFVSKEEFPGGFMTLQYIGFSASNQMVS